MTELSILLLIYFTKVILASNAQQTADMLSLQLGRILQEFNEQQCPPPKIQAAQLSSLESPNWQDLPEQQSPPETELKEETNTSGQMGLVSFKIALAASIYALTYQFWQGYRKGLQALQQEQLKQQQELKQREKQEQREQQELKLREQQLLKQQERALQHNDTLALTALNNITTHFTADTLWHKGECAGEYHFRALDDTFALKGESNCQLPTAQLQSVLLVSLQKHLNVSCILANSILTCRIDLESNEQLNRLQNDNQLRELQSEVLKGLKLAPAYKEYKYQNTLAQVAEAQRHYTDLVKQWLSLYEKAKADFSLLQNECKALGESGIFELNTKNARSKKQYDRIVRSISAFENNALSVPFQQITAYKNNNESNQTLPLQQHLQNQSQCEQLLHSLSDAVQYIEHNNNELATTLTKIRDKWNMLIQGLVTEKPQLNANNPLHKLEEKRRQRELLEAQLAQERERNRQEAEQKKAEFQRQQAIEKQRRQEQQEALAKKKAYQLRLFAEQKALNDARNVESLPTRSACSSAVSSGQLREKVVSLGDLALRFGQIQQPTALQIMEYKYAMLSQCLRLFELTHQVCQTDLARRIRNALMHRHRYIVMESLYAFVNAIAHQLGPNSSSLEDLLIQLPSRPNQAHLIALNRVVDRLKDTEFCVSLLHVEREEATGKQQLESIQGLLEDLSQIKTKEDLNLALFPDKVLAVKGILLCIGECYQQLSHLGEYRELTQSPEWRSIFLSAKALRDNLGHSSTESPDDIVRFHDFIRRSSDLAVQLRALQGEIIASLQR